MNLNQPTAAAEPATPDVPPAGAGFTSPFWTEEEYQRQVAEMVIEETPTVFAVVEDRDDRFDGWIAAWVLEFSGGAEVICTEGHIRMSMPSKDRVLTRFGREPGVTARLVPASRLAPS